MSVMQNNNPWKWSTLLLAVLIISFIGWYFLKDYQVRASEEGGVSARDEVVIPVHVAEANQDYSDFVVRQEEFKASKEPIRKTSTVCKGDSFYQILLQNSISHTQAYEILKEVKSVFDLSKVMPGHEVVLVFSSDNEDLIGMEYEISDHDRLVVSINDDAIQAHRQQAEKTALSGFRDEGMFRHTERIVQPGDNLFDILRSCGIPGYQIDLVAKSVKKEYNLSGLVTGNTLSIWVTRDKPVRLSRMTYEIDDLNSLVIEASGGVFKAHRQTHDLDVRFERAEGTITTSLYESAVQAGLSPEIVMGLTDIFAWDINFFTDIREGDTYTVLYEKYYVGNTFKGYGRVMAARFMNQGEEHVAVYYNNGKNIDGYYDERGKPIRKLFLKAPLNYRRISSQFSYKRMHPIFHVMRPHLGVDYAAPSGTPVVALGQGSVIFKGWSKGFGKCLQIKHPGNYVTYYGHLKGYPKRLSKGAAVDQGEVIGFVGMTGYATGPHLDFRVRQKGKFVNPLSLRPVNGSPLKGRLLAQFKEVSVRRLAMLDDASLNYTMKLSRRE